MDSLPAGAAPRRPGSVPELDLRLDSPAPAPRLGPRAARRRGVSPNERALYGAALGVIAMGATFALLGALSSRPVGRRATLDVAPPAAPHSEGADAPPPPAVVVPTPAGVLHGTPLPSPWRVNDLAGAPDLKLVEGTIERRPFVDALGDGGIPRAQVYRILDAFRGVKTFNKTKPRDTFVAALELPGRRVKAFEYQAGPTEIYQARARDDGALVGSRLDLHVEQKRIATALTVGDDLAASLLAVGLDASLLEQLDDALEGRTQLSSIRIGSGLRIVADYETALGVFARYTDLAAVELSAAPNAEPLRVYHFKNGLTHGYYDARGRQPFKGGFRTPIPFARISSRFNMHRMHPILHVVRPHNGVDFAASTGTPVYAAAAGTIDTIGESGPSGNLITIKHEAGLTTGYAHLSRFAPHLKVGQSVDTRQLIGYAGSTGRSTGPHLHFSTKKNGVFIDPLTLKLDGDRVLPKEDRAPFEALRVQLDRALDAVPPPTGPLPHLEPEPDDQEPLEDTDHVH